MSDETAGGVGGGGEAGFDDLAGHTIEELSDYLDRGLTPPDVTIDASPGCQLALASLRRLRTASRSLLGSDASGEPSRSDGWVQAIIDSISLDVRAGRDVPVHHSMRSARLAVTEGAIRGLVRGAGDGVGGVLVGRCRLDGDVTVPGSPITVLVDVTVLWGENIPAAVDRLRAAVFGDLIKHTELEIAGIDVTVHDIAAPQPGNSLDGAAVSASTDEEGTP